MLLTTSGTPSKPINQRHQAASFSVETTGAYDSLTNRFYSNSGWTGGDGCYSIAINKERVLWLFGDSFIGRIKHHQREKSLMIHNSAAWMEKNSQTPLRYFWRQSKEGPQDLLNTPNQEHSYFWPGAMTWAEGKLAIFCKRIVDMDSTGNPFGFSWRGQDLILVDNPLDKPTDWRFKTIALDGQNASIMPGSACFDDSTESGYIYVFATMHKGGDDRHLTTLLRIRSHDLSLGSIGKFQYLQQQDRTDQNGAVTSSWSNEPEKAAVLFADGAPEMSISRIHGLPGYWATYTANGLGNDIYVRHAARLTGCWSEPLLLYRCQEPAHNHNIFCYSAKAHPELTSKQCELIITYCTNLKNTALHQTNPPVYFPKAIKIKLAKTIIKANHRLRQLPQGKISANSRSFSCR